MLKLDGSKLLALSGEKANYYLLHRLQQTKNKDEGFTIIVNYIFNNDYVNTCLSSKLKKPGVKK